MKKETVFKLVVAFIFMSVLFLHSYMFNRKTEMIWSKLEAEYPLIEKQEHFNNSKITGIYKLDKKRFRIHTNSWMITLNDSIKRDLIVGNELRTDKRLHEILKIGDYLHKLPDSTAVTIFRIKGTDTLEFHFPLHGKNLRPLQ
jgi:hypothetical protein